MSKQVIEVTIIGLSEDVYTESGDYSSGFWHNKLNVDLEELANGNLDKAFAVIADIHDTSGQSFREYHGIEFSAKLPNGVTGVSIQQLCNSLASRAAELCLGFAVEWNGSNHVAVWRDNDGEQLHRGHVDYSDDYPNSYWPDGFREDVANLEAYQVCNLADSENLSYVQDAVESNSIKLSDEDSVLSVIHSVYGDNDGECHFINHAAAAAKIWERVLEERAGEE